MSRPRYDWWGYVKGMIRRYPALCRQYWDLHSQSMTALYGPQGGAGDDARKTERLAIRELPATKQREYEAVRLAVIRQKDGNHMTADDIPALVDEALPQQAVMSALRKYSK